MKHRLIYIAVLLIFTACSTTKNLPEGEILYTGMKKTEIISGDKTDAGKTALDEVKAALACPPNNALFGSSSIRVPLPFGLWIYNDFQSYKKGLGKWIFKKLAATPVLISTVNPDTRIKVARNLLHDYGFFNGDVTYKVIPSHNPRKAKIQYQVDMRNSFRYDSVAYTPFNPQVDSLLQAIPGRELLKKGDQFNVIKLEEERQRISTLLRGKGYYYFRPDYIGFLADTTNRPGWVRLRIVPKAGLPSSAFRPWRIGSRTINLVGMNGELPTDSFLYKDLMINYSKSLQVRPPVLYKRLLIAPGDLYSQQKHADTQENLNRLGIFRYTGIEYEPQNTNGTYGLLDMKVNTAFDLPLDGEMELNFTSKSNDQMGPGAVFSLSKKNVFHGGETLSLRLRGSYEWQTNNPVGSSSSLINSYEFGISGALNFPRIVFPWLGRKMFNYPASTDFRLSADQLNRAKFFKILSLGGNVTYNVQSSPVSRHTITPFKLTFNVLQHKTLRFDSIAKANPALYMSMQDQFIPAMSYTYTYDNSGVASAKNKIWWETSVTSAGNVTSALFALGGNGFKKQKNILGSPFAQFFKTTSEIRYNKRLGSNQSLAMRLMGGVLFAYGNSDVAPFTEQFSIGGANSLRAFTIRSLGPGSYKPEIVDNYSYIGQTGNIKIEANAEYRFKMIGNLNGAFFLDAGNIWLLRQDEARPGGQLRLKNLAEEIALGTGCGLRYDLSYLVVRLDMGIALHAPYETTNKGYYNIPTFKDGMGIHLAIGYPF